MKIKAKTSVAKAETVAKETKAKTPKAAASKAAPKGLRVTFAVRAEPGSKVFLAGTFNNWDPTSKELSDKKGNGEFSVTISLPAGDHQYKFVIDGTWCADPENPDWVQNDHGTLNSVKHVG